MQPTSDPCFSMILVEPFIRYLKTDPKIQAPALPSFSKDPDARVPIRVVLSWLASGVQVTGKPDLGLRAARHIDSGDHAMVEFVATTSPTGRDGLEALRRYIYLLCDAADFSFITHGDRATLRLGFSVPLHPAAIDFMVAAVLRVMIHPLGSMDGVELAFTQPQPTDTRLYRELADAGSLRFEAPFDGIVFPQSLLEAPMPDSNAKLHRVLRKEAERALAEYTSNGSLSDRVRVAIRARLSSGNVTAEQVCKSLFMGKRTLVRHLEEEGTTFGTLLDESRRALAEHYLCSTELSVERIAGLLGYSRTASFSRAFRRWSDRTPLRFRRDSQAQA